MHVHKLFGISAILLSLGFVIHSLGEAYALQTPMVSLGSNPVFSKGAYIGSNPSNVTIAQQSGQEIMVSDIFIHADNGYNLQLTFQTSSGTVVGVYRSYNLSATLDVHLNTPLRVPEGEDLVIVPSGRGVYSFSGYRSQP